MEDVRDKPTANRDVEEMKDEPSLHCDRKYVVGDSHATYYTGTAHRAHSLTTSRVVPELIPVDVSTARVTADPAMSPLLLIRLRRDSRVVPRLPNALYSRIHHSLRRFALPPFRGAQNPSIQSKAFSFKCFTCQETGFLTYARDWSVR